MMRNPLLRKSALPAIAALLFLAACCSGKKQGALNVEKVRYFDAHSHTNGILPYQAYADPETFIHAPENPEAISQEKLRQLWNALAADEKIRQNPRVVLAALDTLKKYSAMKNPTDQQIDAALERVLTATPFTEFDSAYAVRGEVSHAYLEKYYKDLYPQDNDGNKTDERINNAICDATILELAVTNTVYSEQFLSFVGGWGDAARARGKQEYLRCFIGQRKSVLENEHIKALGKPLPRIRVLVMTHTSELGATAGNKGWLQYAGNDHCEPRKQDGKNGGLIAPSATPVNDVRNALLGRDGDGKSFLQKEETSDYFDGVTGIDIAGPETTCFTAANAADSQGAGMDNYKRLVRSVYSAARERRSLGWHGKLLVHAHVGEGGATYKFPAVAKNPFSAIPDVYKNKDGEPVHVVQARKNIKKLIQAVSELKSEIQDLGDFVVFRFGHVTQADPSDAFAMGSLGIEADVNLASNISTRSYYSKDFAESLAKAKNLNEAEELKYSDPVREFLGGTGSNQMLANHSLKYLLEAGVRTLLGSDGGGVEHSYIEQEYQRAEHLIQYWNSQDENFGRMGISIDTIHKNVQAHLKDMGSDTAMDKTEKSKLAAN